MPYHFVDAQLLRVEHKIGRLDVDGTNREFFVIETDVLDLGPLESGAGQQLVALLVNVESHRGDAQPEVRVFLVLQHFIGQSS